MSKVLRIIFCCISAAIACGTIFVFVFAGIAWGFVSVAAAAVCFLLCLFFKGKQQKQEQELNPAPPVGDFITGRVARKTNEPTNDNVNDAESGNDGNTDNAEK